MKNNNARHEQNTNELMLQAMEANRRKLELLENDTKQKNELLAKLQAEIDELNKLFPGNKWH